MPTVIVFFVMFVAALFGHGDEVAETPAELLLKERVAGTVRAADAEEQTLQQQIQAAEQEGNSATVNSLQEQLRDVHQENVQEIREERQRLREERRQQREVVQAVRETFPEPVGLNDGQNGGILQREERSPVVGRQEADRGGDEGPENQMERSDRGSGRDDNASEERPGRGRGSDGPAEVLQSQLDRSDRGPNRDDDNRGNGSGRGGDSRGDNEGEGNSDDD